MHRPRVLVTGATGFTARYVIPELKARDYEIFEIARNIESGERRIACDICDAVALRDAIARARPDYVIHLAGTQNLPESGSELAFRVNVQGTLNLLEACAGLADVPKKILLPSSAYVYGDTGPEPADENAPLKPSNEYGRSKLEMERIALRWFERLPIVIARPFNYTGVGHGERFLVPKLVQVFREKGNDTSFVDPDVVRDFSDVRWIAAIYAKSLYLLNPGQTINVCSGEGVALCRLVSMLEKLTARTLSRKSVENRLPRPTKYLVGSPNAIHALIGRSPIGLEETLRWMLKGTF